MIATVHYAYSYPTINPTVSVKGIGFLSYYSITPIEYSYYPYEQKLYLLRYDFLEDQMEHTYYKNGYQSVRLEYTI